MWYACLWLRFKNYRFQYYKKRRRQHQKFIKA
jgi:hypothetical protein